MKKELSPKVIALVAKLTRGGWSEQTILGYLKDIKLDASQKRIRIVIQATKNNMRVEEMSQETKPLHLKKAEV
ncbi:hypothetical protein EHQ53_14065 [Leptospira langatensis]|uniref:Uncharacterized protein n=1 Tax=Leptospira langatensis TaxID=2484983 RepID=A0ABY2M9M9_9LEPT|nr:hypothetical protein [Leptospira langatensis]TGL39643.1 hypothetical protein EHQ53_14065 [Leptospira langatensis]